MIDPLLQIMAKLRDPNEGCDWDKAQTFETIAPYTLEEAYEVFEAINNEDMSALKDELGDLLLQVVFHARMAEEQNQFSFSDVVEAICRKMTRRHPHIFGDDVSSPGWEALKARERSDAGSNSAIDGVASALPALMRAQKIQKRAARVGFDWQEIEPVKQKLFEEIEEFESARTEEEAEDELGDILFAAVNLARHHKIDAETALKKATAKFEERFRNVEKLASADLSEYNSEELDAFWNAAKLAARES